MPRLIAPTEKEFSLTVDSHYAERMVGPDDPIVVKFRQATEATNLKRQEFLARPIKRMWEKDESGADSQYREEFLLTSFGKRMAVDVYLTMTHCNITDEAGKPVFTGRERTFEEFLSKWGRLWSEWAETIYGACLRVNPSWGFGVPDENEDEEALTEGEEVAGVAAS
ncbi:MAG: hypothetical protein DPW09_42780 [Anaerolineae bacterium]|nr:hypothetical protein [Anaerolineales bacterium]MCQ3980188.1 hypothetical protein [Anaerolineae bacterium]